VNASPLIYLAHSGHLDLLRLAGEDLVVPVAVASEIKHRGPDDPTARAIANTPWLHETETPPVPAQILAWDLGDGESSVLAWALAHPGTLAIVDDLAARRCAATLRIAVRGTLGLVLLAKQQGHVPSARAVLMRLRQAGMYLADDVMKPALALVGE
jgi:predicted nucleic acid-binding protein